MFHHLAEDYQREGCYPLSSGCNFDEIKEDANGHASCGEVRNINLGRLAARGQYHHRATYSCRQDSDRMQGASEDYECLDWFICFRELKE